MKIFRLSVLFTFFALNVAQAQVWETRAEVPVELAFPVVVTHNGYIHVMGGGGPSGATTLHLRYSTILNKWDTMAAVPYAAQQPAGAVLNGKIHFFGGGYPNSGTPLNKHYIYDPTNNTWAQGPNLPGGRVIQEAATLAGKIYTMAGQPVKTVMEMYDPDSNKWFSRSPLPDANFWYSTIVQAGSGLYRFGGGGYTAPSSATHKYNASTDSWTSIRSLPDGIHGSAGAVIGNKIYIVGGYSNGAPTGYLFEYDIAADTYVTPTTLDPARSYQGAVAVDSCLYVIGGSNNLSPEVGKATMRFCPYRLTAVPLVHDHGHLEILRHGNFVSFKEGDRQDFVLDLTVFDMWGKTLYTHKFSKEDIKILDIESVLLPSGIAIIQASDGRGTTVQKLTVFH